MKISSYTGGFVETNGYLVETPDGNLLIDAPAGIQQWLNERGVRVDHLLLTHQHYDHVESVAALQDAGAQVHAFAPYSPTLTLENLGLPLSVKPYAIDHLFDLSRPLELVGESIQLAHVPGHSTDSVTFYFPNQAVLFSGDTIFAGSIGRSDLPGGSTKQLLDGIAEKLLVLPGMTQVFPGHGSSTTIDAEMRENPFL
ncbi:MAG: MBL fold metallo-hydrolase [Luteolibacter sp.]